jgi:uncharacterized protein (TIGR02246 family)
MKKILTIILAVIILTFSVLAQNGKDEQEIRDIIAGSDRAKLNANVSFFERTYADDYSYTSATGVLDTKANSLEWYKKNFKENPPFRLSSMKRDAERIKVAGNIAIATGTWSATIEGTKENPYPPYTNNGRFTTVLERRNGRWLIIAEHDSEALRDHKLMEQQVLKAGREYNELMKRLKGGQSYKELVKSGDIATLDKLLAEEYTYTSRDGEASNKAEDLESYKTNQNKVESADILDQKVRVISNNTAVETGSIRYKGINKDKPFDITKLYTTTWVWRGGRWQIASDHTSAIKPFPTASVDDKSSIEIAGARGLEFSSAVVRASASAWAKTEVEALVNIYTDDAILFPPKGEPIKGREAIRAFWTRTADRRILEHSIKTERADMSGDLLTEHGRFTAVFQSGGNTPERSSANFISVWKRGADGIWRKHLDCWR